MSISYLKQIEKLQADVAHLKQASEAALKLVDIVTTERDALQAQVEVLRIALSKCRYDSLNMSFVEWSEVQSAYRATPAACLAQVRAEAGRAGFIAGATDAAAYIAKQIQLGKIDINLELELPANKYAESIRQGGAE